MNGYRIVLLGHEEKTIQRSLDTLAHDERIIGVVSVGVNVLAIVDRIIFDHVQNRPGEYGRLMSTIVASPQTVLKPKPAKAKLA